MGYSVKEIDELASIHEGIVKLAGAELGVASFGIQVLEVGEERVSLSPGRILRVAAGTKRRFEPGADGVRILAIGCTPGRSYERPDDFRLAVRS